MLPGPILRITCPKKHDFMEPVSIHLPLSLREQQRLDIPDLSLVRVRVWFKDSSSAAAYKQEWTEITEELETTPSFDGAVIKFSVRHFSGYVKLNSLLYCFSQRETVVFFKSQFVVCFSFNRPPITKEKSDWKQANKIISEENSF